MSHSASVRYNINTNSEKTEIDALKSQLCNLRKTINTKYIIQSIDSQLESLNDLEHRLQYLDKNLKKPIFDVDVLHLDKKVLEYTMSKSRLIKVISNLSIDFSFKNLIKLEDQEISDLILQNGFLSNIVICRLEEENLSISPENFLRKLEEIKQERINEEQTEKIRNEIKNLVLSQKIDDKLKRSLLNEFLFITNYQELADFVPYATEIINQYNEALKKHKIYTQLLEKHKYKHKKIEFIIQRDAEDKLKPRYAFISKFSNPLKKNNEFLLTFNLDGSISYDIGDYEKHMCWSLSDELEKDLEKHGYFVKTKNITRSVSGARPLSNARKLREGEK
ncbi:hypothetical protein [Ureaplasma zalophigenitalium]|uniref:Uncharacterized protein n=1 Tax=Ureaplasma zalophigenitalium TaxID=907723 RepID=A0ABT3BP98_9BACT|nr:hypothetical protein [Ureaplasma zalophigenitalium]MCV3754064.1 hypothetical protein [Ureaplasma zalophigenitalium]